MATHPTNPELRFTDGAFYANDPHSALLWARENAPVYREEESGVWGVMLYEDIMAISKTPETFSNAGGSVLKWVRSLT